MITAIIVKPQLLWIITPPPPDILITNLFHSSSSLDSGLKPQLHDLPILSYLKFSHTHYCFSVALSWGCSKMCSPHNAYFWTLWLLLKALVVLLSLSLESLEYVLKCSLEIMRALLGSQAASQPVHSLYPVLPLRFQGPEHQFPPLSFKSSTSTIQHTLSMSSLHPNIHSLVIISLLLLLIIKTIKNKIPKSSSCFSYCSKCSYIY